MCPSYKATRDRRYSPKGRASLMREWLRLLAENGINPLKEAAHAGGPNMLVGLMARAWNSFNPANRNDFSHEVRAAMDTCLTCKACAGQCPVKVNVPAFRSKFLELYHTRYLRPVKDPIVSAIESALPLMARLKPAYNALVGSRSGKLLMRLVGLTALPLLAKSCVEREAARLGVQLATLRHIERLSPQQRADAVVIVPDAFTTYFNPEVVLSALQLAKKLGFTPYLSVPHQNGKTLHVHGYLRAFQKRAQRTIRYLDRLADMGIAMVGLDPSMTLTFRSEYMSMPAAQPRARVLLPQEWLVTHLERLDAMTTAIAGERFRLLLHCTERTNAPASATQWATVFGKLGIHLDVADVGCCGMAGTFGHEVRNREISEKLYAMTWAKQIGEATDGVLVMATGYSCRSQVKEIDRRKIPHPVEVLNELTCENSRPTRWHDM